MANYFLPKHVYFCGRGAALVFLDLRGDAYTMLKGKEAATFRTLFTRAPCAPDLLPAEESELTAARRKSSDALVDTVHDLLASGLLTMDKAQGKAIAPTDIRLPVDLLIGPDERNVAKLSVRHVCTFLLACTIAAIRLRLQKIENTVEAVRRRKALRSPERSDINLERARHLVGAFNRLRFLFPASYLCLFDSLALIEFLAQYDIFPTWIFAVQFEPWSAHCWVQEGEVVFNEETEETENYIPIMAV